MLVDLRKGQIKHRIRSIEVDSINARDDLQDPPHPYGHKVSSDYRFNVWTFGDIKESDKYYTDNFLKYV